MNLQDMIAYLETRGFKVTVARTKTGHMFKISKYDYHAVSIYEDGFGGEGAQEQFLDRLLSTWDGGYRRKQKLLEKKVILVGIQTPDMARRAIDTVHRCLYNYGVHIEDVDYDRLRIITEHTEVRYITQFNMRNGCCDGLRADAIFGIEAGILIRHAKPDAFIRSIGGIGLVDYIYKVEREASDFEVMHSNSGGYDTALTKRYLNSVYGIAGKASNLGTLIISASRGNGAAQACLKDIERAFWKNVEKEIVYGGENNMTNAEKEYVRNDVSNVEALANAFKNLFSGKLPGVKNVIFSGPCTIVIWEDKTKTVVRCKDGEVPDYEKGLAMAIAKKALGTNKSGSNYYDIFKKWLPKPEEEEVDG